MIIGSEIYIFYSNFKKIQRITISFQSEMDASRVINIDEKRKTSSSYAKFSAIKDAIAFSKYNGMLPVFARDTGYKSNLAAKDFLVCGYDEFWKRFKNMKPEERCFYEIVSEGLPCKFHIDSEVKMEYNPSFNPEEAEKGFFKYIDDLLKELEFIEDDEKYEIFTLNSSKGTKYSKHFFIEFKKKKFANNYHVGAFMRKLKDVILSKEGEETTNPYFFVDELPAKGRVIKFFADMTIYTKNRNFRTYGSSKKLGGYRPLLLIGEDPAYLSEHPECINRQAFFDTIIQYIDPEDRPERLLRCMELDGTEPHSRAKDLDGYDTKDKDSNKRKITQFFGPAMSLKSQKTGDFPPFVNLIESEINKEWGSDQMLYPKTFDKRFKIINFASRSHQCRMKMEGLQDPSALHKDHINFRVYLKKGTFVQGCFTDNDTCNVKITASDGTVKTVRKYTIEYNLSSKLRSEINQYFTDIEEGEAFSLAKTIVSIYQNDMILSRDDKISK